jgi:hypothetical protein
LRGYSVIGALRSGSSVRGDTYERGGVKGNDQRQKTDKADRYDTLCCTVYFQQQHDHHQRERPVVYVATAAAVAAMDAVTVYSTTVAN